MKAIFDNVSRACSKTVTHHYSTSFSTATRMLAPSIRQDIYNIYGFVRFADEIVDTFHDYDKEKLFNDFEVDLYKAIKDKISLNPILNSFQETVHKYQIDESLYRAFMKSMRLDLHKSDYLSIAEYKEYIYGSADVVGLMCLKVFVKGDHKKYEDFKHGLSGISHLPVEAKFGVYTAYIYYRKLLHKLKKVPSLEIRNSRIRVPDYQKAGLLAKSYISYRLKLI